MAQEVEVNQSLPSPVVFERSGEVRTTSRDVADLFEKRHDQILRDIGNLVADLPDRLHTFEETVFERPNPSGGAPIQSRGYEMTRDGFTLLAMGFTGKKALKFKLAYIEAFNRMETALRNRPAIDLNNPADLRMLLANYANDKIELQAQVADLAPKAQALDRIATADGSLCITDAAKALQMRPKDLFSYLQAHGWIYRRPNSSGYLGYQSKTNIGLLEHKMTTVLRADGSEKVSEQVRITPKGLTKLSALIQPFSLAA